MRTSFPLDSGETQKGSTRKSAAFQPCSTSGHSVQRPAGFSISIHERGRRAGGSLGCRKTDRPQAGGPLGFGIRCICHAPPAWGVFQAAGGSGCHSSTAPPPPWRGLARTAGLPRKSVGGREQVSLSPALSSRPACHSRVKGSR